MKRALLALALALSFAATAGLVSPAVAAPPEAAAVSNKIDLTNLVRLDGTPLPPAELQGKVVLFVNVASQCGYTPQYDGLQKLYAAKKDSGLVIVGVPSNQFGAQEPGTAEEIATFCRLNYGVTFPLLQKQDVNGSGRTPLYAALVGSGPGGGADIRWNFEKFLVGRDGAVRARFGSKTTPDAAELLQAIDAALKG